MSKKIIVFTGDPNSVNSEIIYKCWKKLNYNVRKKTYFISNINLLKSQFKKLKYNLTIDKISSLKDEARSNAIKVIDVKLNFRNPFKVKKNNASEFIKNSLNLMHKLGLKKDIAGVINLPINKIHLNKKNIGVTEFLALKCKVQKNSEAMLIKSNNFSVSPISTHIDLKKVSKKINKDLIIKKTTTIHKYLKMLLKRKPKIGLLGLNPHNAELRKNSEESNIIIPSIKILKRKGFNIKGPLVADTVFINEYKNFDVIIGMYHDQVLAPFKALYKFDAINITLGLKYIRVSPDHGIAANIIGKNKADITSTIKCFNLIDKLK